MSSSGGRESDSAESPSSADDSWAGLPPSALTENDYILIWWLPDYDETVRKVVAAYQWTWQAPMLERLEAMVPEAVLRAWRDSDPFCRESSWQNVLLAFAWGRAVQLGISSRPALRKECSGCSREFLESDLSHRSISRLGVGALDVCERCLRQAFYAEASAKATAGWSLPYCRRCPAPWAARPAVRTSTGSWTCAAFPAMRAGQLSGHCASGRRLRASRSSSGRGRLRPPRLRLPRRYRSRGTTSRSHCCQQTRNSLAVTRRITGR
jgi:hypothetical protein